MIDKKPKNPLYPDNYDEREELKRKIKKQNGLRRPRPKQKEKDEFRTLKKLNEKLSFLNPKKEKITEDEKKKNIGIAIIALIIIVLIICSYYFLIYEPSQNNLKNAQTNKLNELHSLYKGPLASAGESFVLENEIKDCKNAGQVNSINIIGPATKDWKSFQLKAIEKNKDSFNRTMAIYETNNTKNIIMPASEAIEIVNNNNVWTISNIRFEKPDTVSVPILISRFQAGAGLLSVGSIVNIFTQNNVTGEDLDDKNSTPDLSGCTVVSIMRCEQSGEIESENGTSQTIVKGNVTTPHENTKKFTSNVMELIKSSLAGGYNQEKTINLLQNYGIRLSNIEREINLAEIDSQYLLLVEVPQDKVTYILNNMENIVLTIPTTNAPEWMVNELQKTYSKK